MPVRSFILAGIIFLRLCIQNGTNADERVLKNDKVDITAVEAIAFDPYTHGYYKVTERVGDAFKDGLKLKK